MSGKKKIAVVGAGIVGYALGQILRKAGFKIGFVDIDLLRVKKLREKGFDATTSLRDIKTDVYFICVPTPSRDRDGSFDGRAVLSVCSDIFQVIESYSPEERKGGFPTIVVKSTVLPEFANEILSRTSLKLGKDFGFVLNPEFLRAETAEEDILYEEVILGAEDKKSLKKIQNIYQTVGEKLGARFKFVCTDFVTASLIKYKHNLWLATTMGFLMEFAQLCKVLGANPYEVIKNTKNPDPMCWVRHDFLSEGFFDECLPKDSVAIMKKATELGVSLRTLKSATQMNKETIGQNKHIPYDPRRLKLIEKILGIS